MRKATIQRKTAETEISVAIDLDGKGEGRIDTSDPLSRSHAEPLCPARPHGS